MKISIITPNYNYGEFLIKAIKNVFAQTESEDSPIVEHIVIDGGSTDNSVKYMQEWDSFLATIPEERRVRYSFSWVSEKDRGQTDAINKGLLRSTGEIMCWLNADEIYKEGTLKTISDYFTTHPKKDIVYGEIEFIDKDGKFIEKKYQHKFSGLVLLYHGCYIPSAGTFWTRKAFEKIGPLDIYYKVTMDFEYWCRFYKLGCKFGFIPKTLASFAWHDNNVSEVFAERRYQERLRVQHLYAPKIPFGEKAWLLYIKSKGLFAKYFWRQVLKYSRIVFFK